VKFSEFVLKEFKPKKVVLITSLFPPFPDDVPKLWGGIEVDLETFVNELEKAGVSVSVIAFHYMKPISKDSPEVHRIAIYRPYLLKKDFIRYAYAELFRPVLLLKLLKMLRKENPDLIIIGKTYQFSLSVYIASKLLRIPYIVRYDWLCPTNPKPEICTFKDRFKCSECMVNITGVKVPRIAKIFAAVYFPILFLLKKSFWNSAKAFCVVSNFYRDLAESFGVKPNIIHIIPPETVIEYDPEKVEELEKLYRPTNEKIILYVGRLETEKGVRLLIDAFRNVKERDVKLMIIGTGRLENDVKKACEDDERIIYLGYVPHGEIGNYYALADIVVLPSIVPEGYGLVIVEAMSFNKPIIAFNLRGGQNEILSKYEKGILINELGSQALSKTIEQYLKNLS